MVETTENDEKCEIKFFINRKFYIVSRYPMFRYDGHSGRVTPGPIPNPEVKPARVPVCTVLRKRTGTQARCQPLFHSIMWPRGHPITYLHIPDDAHVIFHYDCR